MSTERKAPAGVIGPKGGALDTTWQTPPELLVPPREYWGGAIPFDVATSITNPTAALGYWTAIDDALAREWPKALWVNPPYGKGLRLWLLKMADAAQKGSEIISLLPCARWEQRYFQTALAQANAVCMIRKRVNFIRASTGDAVSGNTYANMYLGWNVDVDRFTKTHSPQGACFALRCTAGPPLIEPVRRSGKRPRKDLPAPIAALRARLLSVAGLPAGASEF
jgi:phage N-6-adenine-methyltransferase